MGNAMKVLIGYDGSPCADAAIEDLRKAGLPPKGEILILSAADVFLPADPVKGQPVISTIENIRFQAKEAVEQAHSLAKQAGSQLKVWFPDWTVRAEAAADSPAWALIKKTDEWEPSLVVVGAHGHSALGRFLGSVSQTVLTQARCTVRVGRILPQHEKLRIFLALDGSPDSDAALKVVLDRSWPAQTEFFLISVIDPKMSTLIARLTPPMMHWYDQGATDERAILGRMLESFATKLRPKGLTTSIVKEGDPKRVLVEEAQMWRADGIFLGARGLSHLKRLMIGGVSSTVAARAHCSVEIVRKEE